MPTCIYSKISPFSHMNWIKGKENRTPIVLSVQEEEWLEKLKFSLNVVEKRNCILYNVAAFVNPITRTTEKLYLWSKKANGIITQVVLEEDPTDTTFGWTTQFKVPILENDKILSVLHFQEKIKFSL